jgi:hypothetical protein
MPGRRHDRRDANACPPMSDPVADGVYLRRDFLPPSDMDAVLKALNRLSSSWTPSEALRALGRGRTDQVRGADFVVQAALDQIRRVLSPAALRWARTCGFNLPVSPHLQLFPVRMIGDAQAPAYQEPHHDTQRDRPHPPICTNVFYAKIEGVVGGDLAVTPRGQPDAEPLTIPPAVNAIASFDGDRVHWVQPLYAGERLSIVVNFY